MKHYICLTLLLLVAGCASAQTSNPLHTWKVTLKVVDEVGNPIAGANAGVGFFTNSIPASIDGITDTNGIFIATHSDTPSESTYPLSFRIEKQGYYFTGSQIDLGQGYDAVKWNPTVPLFLKKIKKPIAMYAKRYDSDPPLGQPVGYDLMVGDWVGPNGKGVNADILFQNSAYRKSGADYEYKVKVTFPKDGDGLQIYSMPESETGSGLRSPHEAPLDGYQAELNKERSAHPGQSPKNDDDPNRIYLFRVRTAKDQEGHIVSAHYGKIYGDFMQFTYYLNPTPNDRNIEFDPKQNLIHGSDDSLKVSAP